MDKQYIAQLQDNKGKIQKPNITNILTEKATTL